MNKKKAPVGRRNTPSIWDKVDVALLIEEHTEKQEVRQSTEKTEKEKKRLKRIVSSLDIVASILWIYTLIKLFAIDVDRVIVTAISPRLVAVLNYRLFLYAALIACLLLIGRKLRDKTLILGTLYVVFFPVVIATWKIPRFVYRKKSWTLLFGMLNVGVSFIRSYRILIPIYVILE